MVLSLEISITNFRKLIFLLNFELTSFYDIFNNLKKLLGLRENIKKFILCIKNYTYVYIYTLLSIFLL